MQIVITVKDGSTAQDVAAQLRWQANLFEGMNPKDAAKTVNTDGPKAEAAQAAEEVATKKTTAKKTATKAPKVESVSFDEEDETQALEESEDDDFMEPAKKPVKAKAKKITLDDVNDACLRRAKTTTRAEVLNILQGFGVSSVTALQPAQWPEVVAAMEV